VCIKQIQVVHIFALEETLQIQLISIQIAFFSLDTVWANDEIKIPNSISIINVHC
jgi:hypothetical protein